MAGSQLVYKLRKRLLQSFVKLTRLFRLVFLGAPQQKTRRTPEVGWTMAVPMVSLIIVNLLVPLMLQRLYLLPTWEYINKPSVVLLFLSSAIGCTIGATVYLHKAWSRSLQLPWRVVQDLLGYDFYIDRLYRVSIVFAVNQISRFSNWFDRYVVDGAVNFVGLASIFSGESLKYSVSGQSQGYMLTIVIGVGLLGLFLTRYLLWGF